MLLINPDHDGLAGLKDVKSPLNTAFVLGIAPQSGFQSGHLTNLPFSTWIYSHNSPLNTSMVISMALSGLNSGNKNWRQTTDWTITRLSFPLGNKSKTWGGGKKRAGWSSKTAQVGQSHGSIATLNREHLRNNHYKKPSSGSAKRDISTAGTRKKVKIKEKLSTNNPTIQFIQDRSRTFYCQLISLNPPQ